MTPATYTPLPIGWQRRAARSLSTAMNAFDMTLTTWVLMWNSDPQITEAMRMTALGPWMPMLFLLCALALVPYTLTQLSPTPRHGWPSALLCAGCFGAALLWVGAVYATRQVDMLPTQVVLLSQAGFSVCMMLLVASNANSERRLKAGLGSVAVPSDGSNRVDIA